MARRIRDPAEIQELVKFGEFFIKVDLDFQKKEKEGLKMAEPAYAESYGEAKEDCYECNEICVSKGAGEERGSSKKNT